MDLLLGRFADAHLAGLAVFEIRAYEALLDRSDPEISDIVLGLCPAGEHAFIAARIRMHHGILTQGSESRPEPPVAPSGSRMKGSHDDENRVCRPW